jgi:hypothetical protein
MTGRKYVRQARLRLGIGRNTGAFIPCDPQLGQEAEVKCPERNDNDSDLCNNSGAGDPF